ncbi:hypothetical protein WA026_015406 [Henosepilachna vigintioctopunctata]
MSTPRSLEQEQEGNLVKNNSARSLFSIFQRESEHSLGEVEGEANPHSKTNFRFKFQSNSLSSLKENEEDGHSAGSSSPGGSTARKSSKSMYPIRNTRRSSLLLDPADCDERPNNNQLVHCENNNNMDPSCPIDNCRQQKYPGLLPCLIALAALIIIAIPLAKILGCLKQDIGQIHKEVLGLKNQVGSTESEDPTCPGKQLSSGYSDIIKCIVKEELNIFDSDKTGKIDFALESSGGRIVKTINTENYGTGTGILGITLCEGSNGPRAIIQANTGPGECWAFKGYRGAVLIKLLGKVRINAISLEHISKKISPTGRIDTAPRDFSVYGLKDLKHPKVLLGRFEYKADSDPIQTFLVQSNNCEPFEYVEFNVESNHGSSDYTCVYRLRVHGTLDSM